MFPAPRRIATLPFVLALATFVAAAIAGVGAPAAIAQNSSEKKAADKPLYVEYKGVRLGMEASEARKILGEPKDKSDAQDFYMFSESEMAQVFYDKGKVMAVCVNYVGPSSGAPLPKVVLGTEIEAKPDGAMHKLVRYPEAGYWVSYSRTGGDEPLVTVTMQKIK
jgi:hypothetical protein